MKRIIALVLCVCCLSVFVLTGCESVMNGKERLFVRYYKFYAKEKIDTPTAITSITEYEDGWGGTVVYFECYYEHPQYPASFSATTTVQMVMTNVTFNYDVWSGNGITHDARNYNGTFIEQGFVSRADDALKGDEEHALFYWKRYQGKKTDTEYNLDLINKKIND